MKDTHRVVPAEPTPPEPSIDTALSAVRLLHAATEELFDAAAERYGINRNDLRCLEILEREGPLRPGRLAQASGLSPAAITKVLDRLEQAGYVTRSGEGGDRRTLQVRTSDRHARMRRDTWRPVADLAAAALAELSDRQLEDLIAVLTDLAEANRQSARRLRRP
ncbi:MarR family transcriptional regulator [Glycomyces sp. TRM65418]|uniref:MarR family winged helix-turn-helix transcriptional regulator n=1 Tax=Glycomyces sp. TRM65418 TaxID=2867006 RepID=UPI001CE63150|nr:MarR family transcriptional regulator [Glycomyces sp. TRM65418]MCC3765933.1 MarR family transcriptional regulator [Glycomyces sp. TRM65418]QZD55515.1 MarR family transcriptional regulator [Glycomyces sp. TRM65418]